MFFMAKRYDHIGSINLDSSLTAEGYLKATALVTKTGVFPYERADGSIIMELRSPEEVFRKDSLKSMELMGIQEDHRAMLDSSNSKLLRLGTVGQDIKTVAPYIQANLVIDTKDGVEAIKRGKNQLSCGYYCDLVMEPGVYDGMAYDAKQTNILYNHLALTAKARLGKELAIHMDSSDAILTEKAIEKSQFDSHSEQEHRMIKLTINGIQYDAAPEVSKEIDRLNGIIETSKAGVASEKAANAASFDSEKKALIEKADGLKAERDAAIAKADGLKVEVDSMPAKIAEGVKSRISLEKVAAKVLSADAMTKMDGKPDLEIKKAVVLARMPKVKLDGESDGYIATAYRLAVESMDEQISQDALASGRKDSAPVLDGSEKLDAVDAAKARHMARLLNGGKLPEAKK